MAPDDIINENEGEQEEEQEQEPNIIDLNNYGMKPYSWRYEDEGGGGGGGVMILHEDENGVLDKTWAEIKTALSTMLVSVYSEFEDNGAVITQTDIVNNVSYYDMAETSVYQVMCSINSYMASAEDEYPTKS